MTQTITPHQAASASEPPAGRIRPTDGLMQCAFEVERVAGGGGPVSAVDARRVGHMRTIVAAHLRHVGLHALIEVAEQIVSELVTNAIEHAGGAITLSLLVTRAEARLLVQDSGSGRPHPRDPGPDAEGGRGLLLVHLLVDELGGSSGFIPETRTAWCSIPHLRSHRLS
ncbi:ATP-binding protein [Streptomyces sp. NPDC051577]|uniref:ATP-binding protein n=1 Tax=Streptomyces sp. NPDC051577 TaxID=3155166 RepID=UPI00342E14CA